MARFIVMLVGLVALGCAGSMPREWKRIDADGRFSFEAPAGARRLPGEGIDSYWLAYTADDLRIGALLGWYTRCSPGDGSPTTVSGHPASIQIEKLAKPDSMSYRGVLCVPLAQGDRVKGMSTPWDVLGFEVRGKSKKLVLRVLQSVSIP